MIIQIRGRSFAGKTTLAQSLMDGYDRDLLHVRYNAPVHFRLEPKRESFTARGVGFLLQFDARRDRSDSFIRLQEAYKLALKMHGENRDVVMEGSLFNGEFAHMVRLDRVYKIPVLVAVLNTPLEICFARAKGRNSSVADEAMDSTFGIFKLNMMGIRTVTGTEKELSTKLREELGFALDF